MRVISYELQARASEADNDPGVVDAPSSRVTVGDLYPRKEGWQLPRAVDQRSLLPDDGVSPELGRPAIAGDTPCCVHSLCYREACAGTGRSLGVDPAFWYGLVEPIAGARCAIRCIVTHDDDWGGLSE